MSFGVITLEIDEFQHFEAYIIFAQQSYPLPIAELNEELQSKVVVGLKVDKETNAGLVSDIKQELRKANALKVMYIANTKTKE